MASGSGARRDRWSAAGLAALALAYLAAGRAYPLDTLAQPGPGVFPLVTGLALLALAAWQLVTAGRDAAGSTAGAVDAAGSTTAEGQGVPGHAAFAGRGPLVLALALVAYAAAVPRVGFLASSFGLVVLACRVMGAAGWRGPLLLAAGVCAGAHAIFALWLGVPLPRGLLR